MKNFVLGKILKFYMQRPKFSLDLMKETKPRKALKTNMNNEYWNLDLFHEQMQKIKKKEG